MKIGKSIFLMVVFVLLFVSFAGARQDWPSTLASEEDQRAILETLIATGEFRAPLPPPPSAEAVHEEPIHRLILVNEPVFFCTNAISDRNKGCTAEVERSGLASVEAGLSKTTVDDFWSAGTRKPLRAQPHIDGVIATSSISMREQLDGPDGWQLFHQKFSLSAGILSSTLAILSHDHERAIIYAAYQCGQLCGFGKVYALLRVKETWHVEHAFVLWVS